MVDGDEDDEIATALATLERSISQAHVQARAALLVPGYACASVASVIACVGATRIVRLIVPGFRVGPSV